MAQMTQFSAKGVQASQLRQRKYELVREHGLPENLVGGSLAVTQRRCGKANCRCKQGEGHRQWSVTLCQRGKKRVERVPEAWVPDLEQAVLETQRYLDALHEVMAINLQLLAETRQQAREKKVRRREKSAPTSAKNDQLSSQPIDLSPM